MTDLRPGLTLAPSAWQPRASSSRAARPSGVRIRACSSFSRSSRVFVWHIVLPRAKRTGRSEDSRTPKRQTPAGPGCRSLSRGSLPGAAPAGARAGLPRLGLVDLQSAALEVRPVQGGDGGVAALAHLDEAEAAAAAGVAV